MDEPISKFVSRWIALIMATISFITLYYVKWVYVFDFGSTAGATVLLSLTMGMGSLIASVLAFRRWQSWLSWVLLALVVYSVAHPPIYVVH